MPVGTRWIEAARRLLWRLRENKKQLIIDALLWAALIVFLIINAVGVNALTKYSSISLRYEKAFSGQAAYQARQYSIEQSDKDTFWLTYWHEAQVRFEGDFNGADATCIMFSGDASLVWPARYLTGTAPGVTDGAGCSVSSALAWTLWGGNDVVGKTINVDDEARIVRGVFECGDSLALVSVRDEDISQSFTAVELSGGPSAPDRSEVLSFARAAGLGSPNSILMGTPASLASALMALPLIILAFYGLALCIARLRVRPVVFAGILLSVLIGFAFLLPWLLDLLPGWMIPTRWSDFSFWGGLVKQVGEDLREYLVLTPRSRDVEYKLLLIKQAGISFVAASLALSVCFRWHWNRSRRASAQSA